MTSGSRIEGAASIWDLVRRRARRSAEAAMLIDESGRRETFGSVVVAAERVAAGLLARGVRPGSTVSWQLPTRIDTVVLSLALSRLGATQNPIIPVYRHREVSAMLRQCGTDFFVTPGTFRGFDHRSMAYDLQAGAARPLAVLISDGRLPEGDPATLPPPRNAGDEVRWIYTTSGTTSAPKGVCHTDSTLLAGGLGYVDAVGAVGGDVGSIAFPFAHIGGPDQLVAAVAVGIPTVVMEIFDPVRAIRLFERHKVTITGGSTAFYTAFLAEQRKTPAEPVLPTVRALAGGGAPKPAVLYHQAKQEMRIPILHGYGMTECPMITMGRPTDTDEQLANTEGQPVPGCEISIRDDTGDAVSAGTRGHVWVRGPMLFKGYLDRAATTDSFDAAGWFRTGDLGYLRGDGHLVLVGRDKDLIIRKGESISAVEIEDVLQTHPSVSAVAVIGLPDPERGERICAVIELRPGAPRPAVADVRRHCAKAGLAPNKAPEQLEYVDAIPRTATMKMLKRQLREELGGTAAGGGGGAGTT